MPCIKTLFFAAALWSGAVPVSGKVQMTEHQHVVCCVRLFIWQSGNQACLPPLLSTEKRHEESMGIAHTWTWSRGGGMGASWYLSSYLQASGCSKWSRAFLERLTTQPELRHCSPEVSARHFQHSCRNWPPPMPGQHLALRVLEGRVGEVSQTAVTILSLWNSLQNKSRSFCVRFYMGEGEEGTGTIGQTCSSLALGHLVIQT